MIVQIAFLLFVQNRILILEQVVSEELVLISGLLLGESYVVKFAILPSEITLRQVDETRRVRLARWVPLVAITTSLLVKLYIVVLSKAALAVEKLGGGPAKVGATRLLDVPVPALAQHANLIVDPVPKLTPVVERDDRGAAAVLLVQTASLLDEFDRVASQAPTAR